MDERTLARFMSKIEVKPNGCWVWTGTINNSGYGVFATQGGNQLAHRVSYEHFVGPIPDGLGLDHICHSRDLSCRGGVTDLHRRCVNFADLEPVSNRINTLRGRSPMAANATKEECPYGHPYDLLNTYFQPTGGRECRTCRAERSREWVRSHHPGVLHGTETHCPQGHEYAGANLYIIPSTGGRMCRTCKREQGREWMRHRRARLKAAKAS